VNCLGICQVFSGIADTPKKDRVTTPNNMKFPDGLQHSSVALGMLSVTHIMPVLVSLSVVRVGMQQSMIRNHIFNI